jgi:hypothetical protein
MISIKRGVCPDIIVHGKAIESEGERETKDAIVFFSDPANRSLSYKKMGIKGTRTKQSYTVYSDKTIRKILISMCKGKCAYCESRITAIYNGDIEHFRPKAGYNNFPEDDVVKPGYYWLASEWENLLFACPFCNQTNTHEALEDGSLKEVVLGKLNQFPLRTENYRLSYTHGNIYFSNKVAYGSAYYLEESERLLIKPCTDSNVESLFKYDEQGAIIPNDGLTGIEKSRAEESIRVYALHRLNLVQPRREKIAQIKAQIRRVEIAIINLNTYIDKSDEERMWFQGILREEMLALKKFCDDDQEYAGLARYFINNYLNAAGIK